MHIIIYGAGALGCFFGAKLQQGGHKVTFVARGPHLEVMKASGLRVEGRSGSFHLESVEATSDVSEVGDCDLIFFAVKNYDVKKATADIVSVMGAETSIVTVQNGVSAQPILADAFGEQRVFPGVVRLPADIKSPGVIRTTAENEMGGITFGPYQGGQSERANSIRDVFEASGISTGLSGDIWRSLWEKFIPLSAFSATTVTSRLDIGGIRDSPASRSMLRMLIDETAAVAQASHSTVPGDAGQTAFDFLMSVPPNIHASMLDDLLRGKRIELDWLSGSVIKLGKELDIVTPSHEFVYAMLSPYIDGRPAGSH